MAEARGVVVLGATGTVGRQALEVIGAFPERFRVIGLGAGSNAAALAELIRRHRPTEVALADPAAAAALRERGDLGCRVEAGPDALTALAIHPEADIVLAAIVGRAGLASTLAAALAGKRLALANKEALVMAGELLLAACRRGGGELVPVDSEHAGVAQLLPAARPGQLRRILLTASGGPLREVALEKLDQVEAAQALAHPTWRMGDKITIDSATMMNKGFEIIEAHWLFGLEPERIEVLVHPESLVHALVELNDGTTLAQLAPTDMRGPIGYALGLPDRLELDRLPGWQPLDLERAGSLTFLPVDTRRYPALALCRQALDAGGSAVAALAAADEVVVRAFLEGRIRFTRIAELLAEVLVKAPARSLVGLEDVQACADEGERLARELLPR